MLNFKLGLFGKVVLETQMLDEGIQELTEAELDGMFMQENGTYVPNYVELKKAILTMYTVKLFRYVGYF